VTLCRLRASPGEVERRLTARQGHGDGTDELPREVRNEIRLMDASSFADACVDTTGVPAMDVPRLVRAACADWPGFTGRLEDPGGQVPDQPGPAAGGRAALINPPGGDGHDHQPGRPAALHGRTAGNRCNPRPPTSACARAAPARRRAGGES
jgi:hypothetical protein